MNERAIFDAALEILDPDQRRAFLHKACGDSSELRARIEALLSAHDGVGSFLDVPAIEQVQPGTSSPIDRTTDFSPQTRGEEDGDEDDIRRIVLSFLQPSQKPGSIGTLGHYEILKILGQGGFGVVLKAFDEKLHRHVAIKMMNPRLAATSPPRKRFLREARAAAAIRHENIVQVHSVEEQPLPYLVMEYISGDTLQQKLDAKGPLSTTEVLHLGRQIAAGLAAAHASGLIHRDIKPGNILIEEGAEQKVKITDFGMARAADDASMTRSGVVSGTPMYMAPEQAQGQTLDHRADLFSLGSVLYQMACGRPPFRAATAIAVLRRVVEDTPRPIQEILPEIPDWLVAIVDKLHAKKPEERFQSAKEVADLLGLCQSKLQAGVTPTAVSLGLKPAPVEPVARAEPKLKEFPVAAVAAGVMLMFTVMAVGLFFLNKNKNDGNVVVQTTKSIDPPAEALPATFKNSIGMEFVKVPKGTGWLGGGAGKQGDTKVVIEQDFYLGKYEVTQEEWEKITGSIPSHFSRDKKAIHAALKQISHEELKRFPVEQVSWNDCQLFIAELNKKEAGTGWIYRLPTEAEWEYACRGGPIEKRESAFDFYFVHPTNTLLTSQANFSYTLNRTSKVGSYEANRLGLFDMHGNVHEWCSDEFKLDNGTVCRVLKGGSWDHHANDSQASHRYTDPPTHRDGHLGLRLARVPVGSAVAVPATTDPDRKAAEWVLSIGGTVRVNSEEKDIKTIDALPKPPFVLTMVGINSSKREHLKDETLSQFKNCAGLKALYLNGALITDSRLEHFQHCKNLTDLRLTFTRVTDTGLAYFKGCKLTILDLGGSVELTDAGMANFNNCKNLFELNLYDVPVSDAGLSTFKACKQLASLRIVGTLATDKALSYFKDCKDLYKLELNRTQITDAGLVHFNENRFLDFIELAGTPVTGSGLIHFKNCKTPYVINLMGTQIDDEGLKELAKVTGLRTVNLKKTKVSAAGIDGLKKALPKLMIEWDGGVIDLSATFKNSIGMEFVKVPKGTGWLGGGAGKPGETKVVIEQDFYLGKYEVTQEEWEAVTGQNPSAFKRGNDVVKDIPDADLKRFPVENVSWEDTQLFIKRLNDMAKDTGWVYRLPKEAEWEYACRGGPVDKLDSAFDYYFAKPTDTLLPEQANFNNVLKRTCKVGSYEPNLLGLYDVNGNVHEWCEDTEKAVDGTSYRVARGGHMSALSRDCRAATRSAGPPSARFGNIGFRLARVPVGPAVAAPAASDTDRKAAEWVLSIGGTISIKEKNQERPIELIGQLPVGAFELTRITIHSNQKVTNAGLEYCKDCKNLTHLGLTDLLVSDEQLGNFKNCKNLTYLNLHKSRLVTDAGLAHFKDCRKLTELSLIETGVTDAGLAYFQDCKDLEILHLWHTQIGDAGLAHLKDCVNIQRLGLRNTKVTDAGLAHFNNCKDLVELLLVETQVGNAGLAQFKDCKRLSHFQLGGTKVTDAGLAQFKYWKNLCYISLEDTTISDAGLVHLADCPTLADLSLRRTKVTEAGVKKLAAALPKCRIDWAEPMRAADSDRRAAEWVLAAGGRVSIKDNPNEIAALKDLPTQEFELDQINLHGCMAVTEAGFALFKECKHVRSLHLTGARFEEAWLTHFADCQELTHLNLGFTKVTDAGLAHFKNCKKLENLDLTQAPAVGDTGLAHLRGCLELVHVGLDGTAVTDEGLSHLRNCRKLTGLNVMHTRVSDAGLAVFKDFELTVLFAGFSHVTDAGLANLRQWQRLTWLDLRDVPLSDNGLAKLKDAKALTMLNLTNTSVGDGTLQALQSCRQLVTVQLGGTRVSDKGLTHLKECKNLVTLNLNATTISDDGLDSLFELRGLGEVDLRKTKVTAIGVKKLSAALPRCKIEWDGGVIEPK